MLLGSSSIIAYSFSRKGDLEAYTNASYLDFKVIFLCCTTKQPFCRWILNFFFISNTTFQELMRSMFPLLLKKGFRCVLQQILTSEKWC